MDAKRSDKAKKHNVQSVERAFALLDLLEKSEEGLTLTQLSEKIGLAKSTTHGLLATMRDARAVEQDSETGRYRLGVRLFELGNRVARSWDIRDAALPVMKRLNKEFGETVHLGAEDNGEVLYLEKIEPDSLVSIVSEVGLRLPMHCSGLGKVLLAQKSPAELKRYLDTRGLPALTARTITTPAALSKELTRIIEQGYAMDDGETMEGLRCVAAPIADEDGRVRYAVSISGQVRDMYGSRLDNIIDQTKKAADDISKRFLAHPSARERVR